MVDRRCALPRERTTRRAHTVAVLALVAGLAAGCSFIPTYQRPAAPVAERFPQPDASGAAAPAPTGDASQATASSIPWQTFFPDARLQRLIGIALANNRDLRLAANNIEQARAAFQIRRADELPTLNATSGITRQHTPGSISPVGRDFTLTVYQVGLGVSAFELDFFGRIRSLSEAALAQYLATEEARNAAQVSLVASVANGYLSIAADDQLIELTRQTIGTREESLRLSKLRFDAGVASELDFRQAQTLVEQARASLAQLRRQRANDENALVLLLGQPLPADLPPAPPIGEQPMLRELPVGLPSDLLVNRPDIRQAEQSLISANANIGAARAAFFPRISLTGSGGFASAELTSLLQRGSTQWSIGPSATLPIFDAGRNRANLALAQAQRDAAVTQYERAIQTAFREVADALAGRATLADQLGALQAQAEAEAARVRLADIRYRGGIATFLDLLDAQRSLYAVQQTVIQVLAATLQNQVALYRALGGGSEGAPAGTASPVASRNGDRSLSSSR